MSENKYEAFDPAKIPIGIYLKDTNQILIDLLNETIKTNYLLQKLINNSDNLKGSDKEDKNINIPIMGQSR